MLLTLSGLPGSGTSTVARLVAAQLGLDHVDGGTVFRAMAAERGLGLAEFAEVAEGDDQIDRDLDARLTACAAAGHVVLESRLAGWLASRAGLDGLRVWIECDERVRADRVGRRDGEDAHEALVTNRRREGSERDRYQRYYGIDLAERSVYDLVLDSTGATPDALCHQIVEAAQQHA